ncbi:MAG: hypothetical protein H6R10_365 [Rhodocyclaceae bacterium]|nr:hypothetical protein [Rhodocyclaceae bacterium]
MASATAFKNWLFRWRSDGTGPIVLRQRRIFILPTGVAFLFATVLIVMLLGAVNYNLALGHALVFLLAGVGLSGMIHVFRNLEGLILTGGRAEPVFAGENAHFPLHLANSRRVPRLALEFRAGDGVPVVCDLPSEGRIRIELPVPARQRGWLLLPRVRLSTRYPLGLFVAWSYLHPSLRCLVYPRPINRPLPPLAFAAAQGERHGQGGQEDFAGLRERQPADSPRHIAWKAVARDFDHRPLLVKQFAGGAQSELWLDWRQLPPGADSESRLSILAGWVLAADAAGVLYGLALPGIELKPAQGAFHRQLCLETLALYQQP